MTISIIMPSYNVGKYIEECLESVVNQTYKDIEIICVDAGSTDGTWETIQKYVDFDSRIIALKSEKKSYGYQMNLGICVAKGEYVGIVETDDFITEDTIENLVKTIADNKVDFIKGGYTAFADFPRKRLFCRMNNNNILNETFREIVLDKEPQFRLADINHIWSGLYKKSFLKENQIKFNETAGASFQDTGFSIIVGLMAKNCIYTDFVDYHYRIDRPDSSVNCDGKYLCIIDEFKFVEKYIEDNNINTDSNLRLIFKLKPSRYEWNFYRLSSEYRKQFRDYIYDELTHLLGRNDVLSADEMNLLKQIMDEDKLNSLIEDRKKQKDIFSSIINSEDNEFIAIGLGKNFIKFIEMQNILGQKLCQDACDNNEELEDTIIAGYTVKKVEEMLLKYKNKKWLIFSIRYAEDIKRQLIDNDVDKDNIICISRVPDIMTLFMG